MKKVLALLLVCLSGTVLLAQEKAEYDGHWNIVEAGASTMSMSCIVVIDGVEQMEAALNYDLGIFCGDECRGAFFPPKLKKGHYKYSPTIYGEDGDVYTCKLWDVVNQCELPLTYIVPDVEPIVFEADYTFGTSNSPYVIAFTSNAGGITLDIPDNNWHLIASPVGTVESANVTNLRNDGYDFYYFDQAQELEWINDKPEGFNSEAPEYAIGSFEAGKGYLYAHSDAETRTLTFPGTANTDPVTVTLHKTAAAAGLDFPDWNLVGNPYNVAAFIDRSFYRMENGAFLPEAVNGAINRMEGVFVVASEEGEQMAFSTEAKANVGNLALNLRKDSKTIDRAIVSFGQGRQLPKLQLFSSSKLYIPQDGRDYAIVTSEGMGEMPLSFMAESNGTYSLNLSTENVEFSYLHLIDNLTGADQDLLANPSYSFSANTTDYASRFRLVFATGNDEDNFAFFSNGSLFVNNEGSAVLQVVDVTGRIIKSESINGCANVSIDAAPGVYMVRLVNGDNMKVQKVVK